MNRATPFDAMAAGYDAHFGEGSIGRRLRAAAHRRIDGCFKAGDRVLELNCGTGEDAVHLAGRGVRVLATDKSTLMLEVVRRKVHSTKSGGLVEVARLDIAELDACVTLPGTFDGVLSNFGGLNCVGDLPNLARALAGLVRPGGTALLGIMGPAVPWEWAWFLVRGEPRKAFRRLRRGGVEWRGLTIRYPSIGAVDKAFAPYWRQRSVSAVGALLPPTYAEIWATRHPRLLATLDACERRFEWTWPLPSLADHYLVEFERTGAQ